MKTTKVMILMAALVGAAAISANAGVRIGFSVGLPVPVVVAPPVVVTAPVVVVPAPIVATVPPCPGVDYVWAPGYYTPAHVWVGGGWSYRPGHFYGHGYSYGHRDGGRRW